MSAASHELTPSGQGCRVVHSLGLRTWRAALVGIAVAAIGLPPAASQLAPTPRSLLPLPGSSERSREERWAVVIGISRHREQSIDLKYAASDARAFADALVQHCGFKQSHIRLLLDDAATAAEIRSALGTWLPAVAGRRDLVAIYYSGHGSPDVDPRVKDDGLRKYLIPSDAAPSNLFATAVPMDDVSAALLRLRSERTVVFLDACFSGGLIADVAARGRRGFHASGQDVSGKVSSGFVDSLAQSGLGRAVLTSSAPQEQSFEYEDLKGGLFTRHVLAGLAGAAAGKDGAITVNGLYEYVWREMVVRRGDRAAQTPVLATTISGPLTLSRDPAVQPAMRKGTLRVVTSPLGSAVFIGKTSSAVTAPAEVQLDEGLHEIVAIRSGYRPVQERTFVAAGEVSTLSLVLERDADKGDLILQSAPGAAVLVDGKPAGVVGPDGYLRLTDLDAGQRALSVEQQGSEPASLTVTVAEGRAAVARVALRKRLGSLRAPTPADLPAGLRLQGEEGIWAKDGAPMVFVSEGAYLMGNSADPDASPQRTVSLGSFWIDRNEVTNRQFATFVRMTAYRPNGGWTDVPEGRALRPATRVSLTDARAYAAWAGKAIPTEVEWEKAARGGDGRPLPYGETISSRLQNLRSYGLRETLDVGSFVAGKSPYGALDMAGNVWEWCDSPFDAYPGGTPLNLNFGKGHFVLRGGSYLSPVNLDGFSVSTRSFLFPTKGQEDVGFRCIVRNP